MQQLNYTGVGTIVQMAEFYMNQRWVPIIVSIVVCMILSRIMIPGLNPDVVAYIESTQHGSAPTIVTLYTVFWMVIFRGLRRLAHHWGLQPLYKACAGLYLCLILATSQTLVNGLEIFTVMGASFAQQPGTLFRVVTTASMVGGAALLWMLADWISQRSRVSGTLLLWGAFVMMVTFSTLVTWNADYRIGNASAIYDLLPVVGGYMVAPLWVLGVGAVALRLRRASWPIPWRLSWSWRSSLDWLLTPFVFFMLPGLLGEILSLLCAIVMGVWLLRRPHQPLPVAEHGS